MTETLTELVQLCARSNNALARRETELTEVEHLLLDCWEVLNTDVAGWDKAKVDRLRGRLAQHFARYSPAEGADECAP